MPRHEFEDSEPVGPDSFSLDDLKRAATDAAAEAEPEEALTVPLRGRGWFVPYQSIAMEISEIKERENADQGLADGPYEEYCYMCASWTAQSNESAGGNPMRAAIQNLIDRAADFRLERVVNLIARYYRKHVQPRVGKHWSINAIRDHITQHCLDPKIILTENIRGVQCFIDAYTANAEQLVRSEGEEGPSGQRRRVDPKQADGFLKMVRAQATLITMLQRLRNDAATGSGNNGNGGSKSM